LPIPEEVRDEPDDSSGSERNFGLTPVCSSVGSILDGRQGGDVLGSEWLRVRPRHKLTSCLDTERRNGCADF
jgi:hypothetical protein